MKYHKGDELVLKIEDSFGYDEKTYRSVKVQVIGIRTDGEWSTDDYVVYVPQYEHINGTWELTQREIRVYNIDKKFTGENVMIITGRHPIYRHIPAPQGEHCVHCNEFFQGTEAQDDGQYFCRPCRINPYR